MVLARGGSKGIPNKNIKLLNNKPLIQYTAEAALESQYISRVILSTDSKKIAELGVTLGLEVPSLRPDNLAQDDTPALSVIKYELESLISRKEDLPDAIILLQPTSPFRTTKHIDDAIEIFCKNKVDSLVSVVQVEHNMNPYSIMKIDQNGFLKNYLNYDEKKNLRQFKPIFYARNGAAIYIFTPDCVLNRNTIYGDKITPYFMSKKDSLDLDDMFDWQIAEILINFEKFIKYKP